MNTGLGDFESFSRRLDEEWLRERLRRELSSAAPSSASNVEEEDLARALGQADPLGGDRAERDDSRMGALRYGWVAALREALAYWPGRLVLAGAACALVAAGVVLDRTLTRQSGLMVAAVPLAKPAYQPEPARGLGMTPAVKPESERKFRDAMAFHGAPDFPARALPLLSEAVTADPSNDQAQFWLGVALLLGGRSREAVGPLEEAARLAPADARYRQYLLFAYLQTGATEKALRIQGELLQRP